MHETTRALQRTHVAHPLIVTTTLLHAQETNAIVPDASALELELAAARDV